VSASSQKEKELFHAEEYLSVTAILRAISAFVLAG